MTKSTITRERLEQLAAGQSGFNLRIATLEESQQLARMALAAMDSEPVAWTWQHFKQWHVTNAEERARDLAWDGVKVEPLYRHAQPAPELKPVGYLFVSDQGAIAYSPADWGVPGFRLAGQIFGDIDVELKPAPVVEREPIAWLNDAYLARGVVDGEVGSEDAGPGYIPVYREAGPQPAPVVPDGYVMVPVEPNGDMLAAAQDAYGETDGDIASTLRAAMLAADPQLPGSEPATVPGKWISVSERMPEDEQEVLSINKMGHRFVSFFDKHSGLFFDRLDAPAACCIEHVLVTHWMPLPAAPQEDKP